MPCGWIYVCTNRMPTSCKLTSLLIVHIQIRAWELSICSQITCYILIQYFFATVGWKYESTDFLSEVKDIAQFCRRFVSAVNLIMTALPLSSSATVYFASLQNISVPWYFHLKQTTQHWQDIFTSTFRNWGRFLAISRHWPFPDCPKLRLIKLVELPKSFTEFLTKAWSEL